jgi:signal peptidase I
MRRRSALAAVAAAFVAFLALRFLVLDLVVVRGHSMEPLLRSGQVVVVFRLAYGLRPAGSPHYLVKWGFPQRGEIVIVRPPRTPAASIKWCAAVAGDPMPPGVSGAARVPEDHIVVLGLNSRDSIDSRHFGPLPLSSVIGRALVVPSGA